jgi:lysozyme
MEWWMALETAQIAARSAVGSIVLAAATFVGIAQHESFVGQATIPVKGDKPTYGYGTTTGVKLGDRITPERALQRLMVEVDTVYAQGVRRYVRVPLT